MSDGTLLLERDDAYVDTLLLSDPAWLNPRETREAREDRWFHKDPVDELISQLFLTGRRDEATAIKTILYDRDADIADRAARALVTQLWSEDWDSEDDEVYNEM